MDTSFKMCRWQPGNAPGLAVSCADVIPLHGIGPQTEALA